MTAKINTLCSRLGYTFTDDQLLRTALTHRSAVGINNERLEFLGDSILNFVIAEILFERYPRAMEGELSRLRSTLVKGDTLAKIARSIALGESLNLGSGELKSGGFRRDSILADALEALLAAVYLDSDFATCRALIRRLYERQLTTLPSISELKDPKTRLQEALQARQQSLPVYDVLAVSGEPHAQQFTVRCTIETGLSTIAEGSSRRRAEQEAARQALRRL